MKIGFIQFSPKLGDIDANIKNIESFADHFKTADLILLPELFNSVYNFNSSKHSFYTFSEL